MDGEIALLASELSEKESLIYRQIIQSEAESHPRLPVEEAFSGLREASNTLSRAFEGHVDRQFDELRGQSEALERGLAVKCAVSLVMFVAWVGLLMAILARPVRQLKAAIRGLGAGEFAGPITIAGPSDFSHLGDQLEWLRLRLLEREASSHPCGENAADAEAADTPLAHLPLPGAPDADANGMAEPPSWMPGPRRQGTSHGRNGLQPPQPAGEAGINRQGAGFQTQRPLTDEA